MLVLYVPRLMNAPQARPLTHVTGHAKLEFPTTCPSCDHSPVEADSCPPNKNLRVTLRRWLLARKKKEEIKAAAEASAPAVETVPAPGEVQPPANASDRPVESVEGAPQNADGVDQKAADSVTEDASRPTSTAPQREVNMLPSSPRRGLVPMRSIVTPDRRLPLFRTRRSKVHKTRKKTTVKKMTKTSNRLKVPTATRISKRRTDP